MRRFYTFLLLLALLLQASTAIADADFKFFKTKYATIRYCNEQDLKNFFFRISGREIDIYTYPGLAKSRVDRIVEKVQAILDMYPEGFSVVIHLFPEYEKGLIAFYSEGDGSITVYADRITENILAHEISHGIIHAYFNTPPPSKIQEILSQYVDKQLWVEY